LPEWIGKIRTIWNITIKPEIAASHQIFRLAEQWTVIIVSEELKRALEGKRFSGMEFIPLNEVHA
jgi:hypothetical protein